MIGKLLLQRVGVCEITNSIRATLVIVMFMIHGCLSICGLALPVFRYSYFARLLRRYVFRLSINLMTCPSLRA
jgi:hypothetical protein